MRNLLYILSLCLLPALGISQARVNITSGYMKIGVSGNGTATTPTYVVLDDSNSNALSASAGSGILSGAEYNIVEWNIGKSTGSFVLPWITDNLTSIPLTATVSAAGINNVNGKNASIEFSTWHTTSDQLNGVQSTTGMPSDCNNLDAMYAGQGSPSDLDNSYNVVDRFWIIDPRSSAGKAYKAASYPTISMTFTYLGSGNGASEVSSPNTLTDGALIAQRFNPSLGTWGDYLPTTNSDAAGGSTSVLATANVSGTNFYRDWTLVSSTAPLPIKLISFNAQCRDAYAILQWSTASESNNNYFTIEKSNDGTHFQTVGVVKGGGNSSTTLNYSATDYNPYPGTSYYRLSQTDMDGNTRNAGTIVFNHCDNANAASINAYSTNNYTGNYIDVQINSPESNDNYTVTLSNTLGQTIYNETKTVEKGLNEFKLYPELAQGVYFLTISNTTIVYHKKILINK